MKTKNILFGSTLLAAAAMSFCATSANAADLTWAGTDSSNSWNYTDRNWSGGSTFVSGDSATFDDTASGKTVSIEEALTAGTITVSEGEYEFVLSENGSISADSLTINEDASLTLESSGELTISSAAISGTLELSDDATLSIANSILSSGIDLTIDGAVKVSDNATLSISGSGVSFTINGTLEISGGTTTISYGGIYDNYTYVYGTFVISGGDTTIVSKTIVGPSSNGGDALMKITGGSVYLNSLEVQAGGTLEISGGTITSFLGIDNYGTVTIDASNGVVFVLNRGIPDADGNAVYTFVTNIDGGTLEGWDSLDYTNFQFSDGTPLATQRQILSSENGKVVVDSNITVADLVWNGTASSNAWTNNGEENWLNDGLADRFYANDNVTFGAQASNQSVSIGEAILAGTITVSGGSYTFTFSGDGSLTAPSLTIDSSASLNLTGSGTFTVSSIEISGSSTISSDSVALVIDTIEVSGYGTFEIVGGEATVIDAIEVSGYGTFEIVGGEATIGSISLGEGSRSDNTFKIYGGTVTILGDVDIHTGSSLSSSISTFVISGGTTKIGGDLTIGSNGDSFGVTIIEISGEDTEVVILGDVTATGSYNSDVKFTIYEGTLAIEGDLSISSSSSSSSPAYNTFEILGGTVTIAGDLEIDSSLYSTCTLKISGGTVTLGNVEVYAISLGCSSTLEISNGTLTIAGDVTLGANTNCSSTIKIYGENTEVTISNEMTVYAGGTLEISGGTTTIADDIINVSGTIKISDGEVTMGAVSTYNYGTLEISGGTTTIEGDLGVGATSDTSNTCSLKISSGTTTITGDVKLGYSGFLLIASTGCNNNIEISGGTTTIGGGVTIESIINQKNTFEISEGTLTIAGDVKLSQPGSSVSTSSTIAFKISGGTTTIESSVDLYVGYGSALFEISGGETTISGDVTLRTPNSPFGESGSNSAVFDISGGTTTIAGNVEVTSSARDCSTSSTFVISGGTTTIGGDLTIDSSGPCSLDISGGTTTIAGNLMANSTSGLATLTISGGTITILGNVEIGTSSSHDYWDMLSLSVSSGTLTIAGNVTANGTFDISGGTITLSSAISNSGTVTISAGSDVVFVLDNLTDNNGTYTLITGSGTITGWNNLNGSNFSLNGASLARSTVDVSKAGQVTITGILAADLVWNGTDENSVWMDNGSDKNWLNSTTADVFYNGDSVTFDDTAESKTVTVEGSVNASSVMVKSGEYTFTGDGSITTESLVVDSGASLSLEGSGELTIDSATISGTLEISDGTITLSSPIENSGTVTVSDSVVFVLDNLESVDGTYTLISGGTIEGWDTLTKSNFTLDGAGLSGHSVVDVSTAGQITVTIIVLDLVWNGTNTDNIWTNDGKEIWLNGDDSDVFATGDNVTFGTGGEKSVSVSGAVEAGTITVSGNGYTFSFSDDSSVTASSLTIDPGASLTIEGANGTTTLGSVNLDNSSRGDSSFKISDGTLAISGDVDIHTDYSTASSNNTFEVAGGKTTIGGSVTIGSSDSISYGNGTFTVSDGTLTISGDVILDAYSNCTSTFEVAGGTATIEGSVKTAPSSDQGNNTLKISDGKITIEGSLDLDATSGSSTLEISGGETIIANNVELSASGVSRAAIEVSGGMATIEGDVSLEASSDSTSILEIYGQSAELTISGEMKIGDNATLEVSSGSLSAETLSIESGSATLSGGTTNVETLTVSSSLSVSNNATLNATSATVSGTLTISGGKTTLSETSIETDGSLTISGGTVSVTDSLTSTGSISVSGGSLELSGTVDISSAISNSGAVIVSDSTVFVLDNLTSDGDTYTIISGGAIEGWGDLTKSNFQLNGSGLGRATVNVSVDGQVTVIEGGIGDLVWNGTASSNVWTNDGDEIWLNGDDSDVFIENDNVTFGTDGTKSVSIVGAIVAGTVTVFGSGYTFTFSEDSSVTADSLTIDPDASLTLAGSGELTTDSATISGKLEITSGEATIPSVEVSSEGTLKISGGTTTADSIDVAGSLELTGGELTVKTIALSDGSSGSFSGGILNISEITGDGSLSFGDGLTVSLYDTTSLSLTSDIALSGDVTFNAEDNETIELSGTLSGSGKLVKDGEGTLTLSGDNTFSGGTTISSGTIVAQSDTALGSGSITIDDGATLEIPTSREFTNATSGNGTLSITNNATVSFTKSVGVKTVEVASDATLSGATTLTHSNAQLVLSGELALDASAGEKISFSNGGTVTLEKSATLNLSGVSPTSVRPLSDSSEIGPGSNVTIVSGATVSGDIETFLATDNTLSDLSSDYAVVYDTGNGLSVMILESGNVSSITSGVKLHDGIGSDFISAIINDDDLDFGTGIKSSDDLQSLSNPIVKALATGNISEASKMMNTLAPDDYAAMVAMPTTSFYNDVKAIDNRLAARRGPIDENARWEFFAQAQGTFIENDDANDTQTFDFDLYGVLAGADYRVNEGLTVGVTVGYDYGKADIHNSGGKIESDDVRITIFAGQQIGEMFFVNAGAQVGYGHYEAKRKTAYGNANGDTDGWNAGLFADVGMMLTLSEELKISARPYVGLAYLHSEVGSFDDNLFDVDDFHGDSLRASIGCGLFWGFDLAEAAWSVGLDASYSHDFCGDEVDIDATCMSTGKDFGITAKALSKDIFSVGPVVSVGLTKSIDIFAGYAFQAGTDSSTGHNLNAGLKVTF